MVLAVPIGAYTVSYVGERLSESEANANRSSYCRCSQRHFVAQVEGYFRTEESECLR